MKLPNISRYRGLHLGFPKSGKTGALVPLIKAGFRIFYCDFDGNPEVLKLAGEAPNFHYLPFADKIRMTGESARLAGVSGEPKAYLNWMNFLEEGKYIAPDGSKENFEPMTAWGLDTIHIVDSMTRLIDAIFRRYLYAVNRSSKRKQDWGAVVDELQFAIEMTMSMRLNCHAIWIGHLQLVSSGELEEDDNSGKRSELVEHNNALKRQVAEIMEPRLFPVAVTKAQSQKIAGLFPCILPFEVNSSGKRIINLQPRKEIDVAIPARLTEKTFPAETGLLNVFSALTGLTKPPTSENT